MEPLALGHQSPTIPASQNTTGTTAVEVRALSHLSTTDLRPASPLRERLPSLPDQTDFFGKSVCIEFSRDTVDDACRYFSRRSHGTTTGAPTIRLTRQEQVKLRRVLCDTHSKKVSEFWGKRARIEVGVHILVATLTIAVTIALGGAPAVFIPLGLILLAIRLGVTAYMIKRDVDHSIWGTALATVHEFINKNPEGRVSPLQPPRSKVESALTSIDHHLSQLKVDAAELAAPRPRLAQGLRFEQSKHRLLGSLEICHELARQGDGGCLALDPRGQAHLETIVTRFKLHINDLGNGSPPSDSTSSNREEILQGLGVQADALKLLIYRPAGVDLENELSEKISELNKSLVYGKYKPGMISRWAERRQQRIIDDYRQMKDLEGRPLLDADTLMSLSQTLTSTRVKKVEVFGHRKPRQQIKILGLSFGIQLVIVSLVTGFSWPAAVVGVLLSGLALGLYYGINLFKIRFALNAKAEAFIQSQVENHKLPKEALAHFQPKTDFITRYSQNKARNIVEADAIKWHLTETEKAIHYDNVLKHAELRRRDLLGGRIGVASAGNIVEFGVSFGAASAGGSPEASIATFLVGGVIGLIGNTFTLLSKFSWNLRGYADSSLDKILRRRTEVISTSELDFSGHFLTWAQTASARGKLNLGIREFFPDLDEKFDVTLDFNDPEILAVAPDIQKQFLKHLGYQYRGRQLLKGMSSGQILEIIERIDQSDEMATPWDPTALKLAIPDGKEAAKMVERLGQPRPIQVARQFDDRQLAALGNRTLDSMIKLQKIGVRHFADEFDGDDGSGKSILDFTRKLLEELGKYRPDYNPLTANVVHVMRAPEGENPIFRMENIFAVLDSSNPQGLYCDRTRLGDFGYLSKEVALAQLAQAESDWLPETCNQDLRQRIEAMSETEFIDLIPHLAPYKKLIEDNKLLIAHYANQGIPIINVIVSNQPRKKWAVMMKRLARQAAVIHVLMTARDLGIPIEDHHKQRMREIIESFHKGDIKAIATCELVTARFRKAQQWTKIDDQYRISDQFIAPLYLDIETDNRPYAKVQFLTEMAKYFEAIIETRT